MRRQVCLCHQDWRDEFQELLPRFVRYFGSVFRFVRCDATRNDHIAEAIALAWKWFLHLKHHGKAPAEFVTTLARYAARAVRSGRTVCGQQKSQDVMSLTAKIKHGVAVVQFASEALPEREPRPTSIPDETLVYEQHVTDDTLTPVPDQVAFRIDWPMFLGTLSPRDRRMAAFLALGHQATETAQEFQLSVPRISQVRKDWQRRWCEFHFARD